MNDHGSQKPFVIFLVVAAIVTLAAIAIAYALGWRNIP